MVTIEKYTSNLTEQWDLFVDLSINGTIFQKQTFLNYHLNRKFKDSSLIIKDSGSIVAILPASKTKTKGGQKILHSHPGASWGGLVLKRNLSFEIMNEILTALDQHCMQENFAKIILINSPSIYYKEFDESLLYLMLWNNYYEKETYISHAARLDQNSQIATLLSKRKRRYIKNQRELQEITFTCSRDINAFYDILVASKKQYKTQPTHSLEELIQLKKLFPDSIQFVIAKNKQKTVGGRVLFFANNVVCLVFYNTTIKEYRKTQLSTLQLYKCMEMAQSKGLSIIDFGVSHTPEKATFLDPKFSLIKFKEQFGAKGTLRTVYEKKFNKK